MFYHPPKSVEDYSFSRALCFQLVGEGARLELDQLAVEAKASSLLEATKVCNGHGRYFAHKSATLRSTQSKM
jgi:hypothetical protein